MSSVTNKRRLGVNIDHVATLRNARNGQEPNVAHAAKIAQDSGADLITIHLREDRRHIKDHDLQDIRNSISIPINLEIALTEEMLNIALDFKPDFVCFVPENRKEITTEHGLDLKQNFDKLNHFIPLLNANNIKTSLFVDPSPQQILLAAELNAFAVEIHTGEYAEAFYSQTKKQNLSKIQEAATLAANLKLSTHAGHGLNLNNVVEILQIPHISELNIGHSIIANALFLGLPNAIQQFKKLF
ncbi:MAG: pyridoxine 5'-phosphate synthase [Rickettsiaceae bacterium]|nr:pyridoxine 5'-phosphate synthase [Rickettsiaceae bacterium]